MSYNAWIRGISENRAAPADVLLRLLDSGWLEYYGDDRELPAEVVDAIVSRGSASSRSGLAKNPFVDPEQRARLVDLDAADPGNVFVLHSLMLGPYDWDWPRPLPVWAIERIGLLLDFKRDKQYIDDARTGTAVPGQVVLSFWNHREPQLRAWSCLYWPRMSDAMRSALLADPVAKVRAWARIAAHPFTPGDFVYTTPGAHFVDFLDHMIKSPDEQWRDSALMNGCVSREVVDHVLAAKPAEGFQQHEWRRDLDILAANPTVPSDYLPQFLAYGCAEMLAGRPDLTPELIRALSDHPEVHVRRKLILNPLLSEQERLAIEVDFTGAGRSIGMLNVQEWPPAGIDQVISQARSAIPRVRQAAARSRYLPAEYVARLADDEDRDVRLALCFGQPEVPAPLLAGMWFEFPDARKALLTRPDFPIGVLRELAFYADSPDPEVRIIATYDPDLPPAVADRLSRDEDRSVRAAALKHPNLPPARIRESLIAPRGLAWWVEAAAANPSLPVEDMHRILDEQIALGGY